MCVRPGRVKPGGVQFEVQCSSHGVLDKDRKPIVMATEMMENERKTEDYGERPAQFPGILSWVIGTFP